MLDIKCSPSLIIEELRIIGVRKDYIVKFDLGINIIYGDSDTGKSSILNLINYCLGSDKINLYSELESSAKYCLLQVNINNKIYTIKRDIFDKNKKIEVYKAEIENISSVFYTEYLPSYSNTSNKDNIRFFPDFLLEELGIPNIKIKQSPSKEDSQLVRLGFRQIMKYCYLDQDDVGNKKILDLNNWAKYVKNKQTFQFIFNILDTQITELEGIRSEKVGKKNNLSKEYDTIALFLRETQISTTEDIESLIENLNTRLGYVDEELDNITEEMKSDTTFLNELREDIEFTKQNLNKLDEKILNLELQIDKNIRLRKEYEKDILKLDAASNFNAPNIQVNISKCPVCEKEMLVSEFLDKLNNENKDVIKKEKSILKRRKKSLDVLIDKHRHDLYCIELEKQEVIDILNTQETLLGQKSSTYVSPYISKRDGLFLERSNIVNKIDKLKNKLKIRNHLELLQEAIETLDANIEEIRSELKSLREQAPSFEVIGTRLNEYLYEFLNFVGIKNLTGIDIDKTDLLPVIRGKKYETITSGGLRTLVSIGYFISIFRYSIKYKTNKPKLLMLDTIGKYLGKVKNIDDDGTNLEEDLQEGVTDPEKYKNIYKYLINIFSEENDNQIIIVDNDIPEEMIQELNPFIIKKFSSLNKPGYEYGLIDDINYIKHD